MDFDANGNFTGTIPAEAVKACSAQGDVSSAVDFWQKELNFEVPKEQAIKWLLEYGAWTWDELYETSDSHIAEVVLWLACCDIKNTGEWFGLTN